MIGMRQLSTVFVALLLTALVGCSTYTVPNYGISADANVSLKSMKLNRSVAVGSFTAATSIDTNCRAVGPIALPNNHNVVSYVKYALENELKVAEAYAETNPKVTLNGTITNLQMSSSKGITRGFWNITLRLESSNRNAMTVSEYYEFDSGFVGESACANTANAFMPAVQNLITKAVRSPTFKSLVSAN